VSVWEIENDREIAGKKGKRGGEKKREGDSLKWKEKGERERGKRERERERKREREREQENGCKNEDRDKKKCITMSVESTDSYRKHRLLS